MRSLAPFGTKDFDPKSWVNDACHAKVAEEPLERYLAELEMRLHLMAEDLDASFEDDSASAIQRIPISIQEAAHVKGDAASLKGDVDRILRKLSVSSSAAEQSVATLINIDTAKSRMEEACSTLKEATELADLFQRVDTVFASGNLQRISTLLSTMRRSLSLVGNVPEFRGGKNRLQELEDRFEAMLEPQLTAAFAEKSGEKVQQIAKFLAGSRQSEALQSLYISVRLPQLQKIWDSFDPQNQDAHFPDWLLGFFDEAKAIVATEIKWTLQFLPEHYPNLVILLLLTFFTRLEQAAKERLQQALRAAGPLQALSTLSKVLTSSSTFAHGLRETLASASQEDVTPLLIATFAPLESQILRYGELERTQLQTELDQIEVTASSGTGSQQMISSMKTCVNEAIRLCQGAAERCSRISQLTEIQALITVVDQILQSFIKKLESSLDEVESRALSSLHSSPSTSSDQISNLLPLLTVASLLLYKVAVLDAHLRGKISDLGVHISNLSGSVASLSPLSLRLSKSEGQLLRKLQQFVSNLDDSRYTCLSKSSMSAVSFSDKAHEIIYNLLMLKLRAELQGVASMSSWNSEEPENKYNLPSFSAYPQQYVTAAGEYLMMLPQLLETLLASTDTGGDEEAKTNADWLDKVAIGAAELFATQILQIPHLTQQGSLQLAADLEYFCNVLHALGVAVPSVLSTWQIATQWADEEFAMASEAVLQDGMAEPSVIRNIAAIRRLDPGNCV